jgi:hypothetical protein
VNHKITWNTEKPPHNYETVHGTQYPAVFVLNFNNEEFFRVKGDVELHRSSPTLFDTELPSPDFIMLDGQPYHQGEKFMMTYISIDDKTAIIFTYGDPTQRQLESKLQPLLED